MTALHCVRDRSDDELGAYMRQVERIPLLAAGEAENLAQVYYRTRNQKIGRKLVEANLRLVIKIAYRYTRSRHNLLDLVQEGNHGLIMAVEKYDPNRDCKLSTFASWWIRAYIASALMKNIRLIKIGTTSAQRKLFFNLHKEQQKLEARGIAPTNQLVAENLGVREQDVIDMRFRLGTSEQSLDENIDDSDDLTLKDKLKSNDALPDAEAANRELRDLLHEKLQIFGKRLKGRERALFYQRLLVDDPPTLTEFGKQFRVSRQRVQQIEEHLRHQIKIYLRRELGDTVQVMVAE